MDTSIILDDAFTNDEKQSMLEMIANEFNKTFFNIYLLYCDYRYKIFSRHPLQSCGLDVMTIMAMMQKLTKDSSFIANSKTMIQLNRFIDRRYVKYIRQHFTTLVLVRKLSIITDVQNLIINDMISHYIKDYRISHDLNFKINLV